MKVENRLTRNEFLKFPNSASDVAVRDMLTDKVRTVRRSVHRLDIALSDIDDVSL